MTAARSCSMCGRAIAPDECCFKVWAGADAKPSTKSLCADCIASAYSDLRGKIPRRD